MYNIKYKNNEAKTFPIYFIIIIEGILCEPYISQICNNDGL